MTNKPTSFVALKAALVAAGSAILSNYVISDREFQAFVFNLLPKGVGEFIVVYLLPGVFFGLSCGGHSDAAPESR
jgi:hypothetical protein